MALIQSPINFTASVIDHARRDVRHAAEAGRVMRWWSIERCGIARNQDTRIASGRTCPDPAWYPRCRVPSTGRVASNWNSALPPPHLRWQWLQLACRYEPRASFEVACRIAIVDQLRQFLRGGRELAIEQADVFQRGQLIGDDAAVIVIACSSAAVLTPRAYLAVTVWHMVHSARLGKCHVCLRLAAVAS